MNVNKIPQKNWHTPLGGAVRGMYFRVHAGSCIRNYIVNILYSIQTTFIVMNNSENYLSLKFCLLGSKKGQNPI